MLKARATMLALGESGELPTEFRLFKKGWNDTENGKFLFDDKAANAVMSSYREWGVDLAIDLEHQMLELEGGVPDPTARDARGWCRLELRSGELWAVQVRWTPDGAERLQQKRQRYVSPAFEADPKTKRVLKMINVAITAMPATHKTPALVAASLKGRCGMDPSLVKQALEAIQKGDAKAALDILKGLVAAAAGAEPEPDGDEAGSEGDGAEGVAPPDEETETVEEPKVVDNAADSKDEDEEDDEPPAKKTERKAMRALLSRMTGKATFAEQLAEVEVWRNSHLTLETERQKLAKQQAVLESAERRKLVTDLVKLGAEFPATIWADPTAQTPSKLKARWSNMPIAELRSHVSEQRAARGKKSSAAVSNIQPPAGADVTQTLGLTPQELAICADMKCEPKDYAALKAVRDGKKGW